jgi:integrase
MSELAKTSTSCYIQNRFGTPGTKEEGALVDRVKFSQRSGRKGKFQVHLYWKGKKYVRYCYEDGSPLANEKQCQRVCALIGMDLEKEGNNFKPEKWFGNGRGLAKKQFEVYVRDWFDHKQDEYAPSWRVSVERYLELMINHFKDRELPEIGAKEIRDFYYSLPKALSGKTKRHIMGLLHKILNDAFEVEDIERVPVFPRISLSEPETRWLDPVTQQKVLAAIPEKHRLVFEFLAEYGCRPSEARALMWDVIDFEKGTITIKRAFSLDTLREVTKTRLIRVLPLTARARTILDGITRLGPYVFTKDGKPYRRMDLTRIWGKAAKAAGVDVSLYPGTRHSRASNLVNNGVPREIVQRLLGHQRADQTNRYARVMTSTVRDALEAVPLPVSDRCHRVENGPNPGASMH